MYNVDPMLLVQMIKGGANPQQLMMSILEQRMAGTPFGNNLLSLAKNNDVKGMEQIARNICSQRGANFDNEFAKFKNSLGIK